MSNSAYADQRKYGGDIANISNSPFTDERRQGGGGGVPGDGTGNVQYNIANQTLNTRLAEVNTIIPDINQGASNFVIGNDAGNLNFDTTNGNIELTHAQNETGNILLKCDTTTTGNGNIFLETDTVGATGSGNLNANISSNILLNAQQAVSITSTLADVSLQAEEIARVQADKSAIIRAGFDTTAGEFENKIDMTLTANEAKIDLSSSGATATNTINLSTLTSGTQGCFLGLNSTDTPTNPDRIVISSQGVPPFDPTLNSQAWFTAQGQSSTDSIFRRMSFFEKKAQFENFSTVSFAGGTENPVYELAPGRFYKFTSVPQSQGQVWTIVGGIGTEDTPWEMQFTTPSTGGGSGNVTSDASNVLTKEINGVTTKIQNIIQGGSGSNGTLNNPFKLSTGGGIEIISDSTNSSQFPSILIDATTNNSGIPDDVIAIFRAEKTSPQLDVERKAEIKCVVDNQATDPRNDYIQLEVTRNLQPAPDDVATISFEQILIPVAPGTLNANRFKCDNVTDFMFASVDINEPVFNFRDSGTEASDKQYWRFVNDPSTNDILSCVGGTGARNSPCQLSWGSGGGGGGGNLNTLDINYDTSSSTLVLSDPVDGVISQTAIVSGRTILVESVVVNGQGTISAFGLSNSIFPPPLEGQTGYFAGLLGNSPPRVPLGALGESLWSIGNTFRVTIAGKINDFDNNDNLIYQVISNRGQTSQNILNSFNLELSGVANLAFGFTWTVLFTVRTLNVGNVLGTVATNSSLFYTDDQFKPETEGAIVSNVNASFDTSIEQYLDCILRFPSAGNSLSVTTAIIERIF